MEHKVITGGEQWLPFARSRIKALQATGLAYASQKFEVEGALVEVRIEPGHEYIRITGGHKVVYEFFVTGPQINANADSNLPASDRLNPDGSAVRLVLDGQTLVSIPLWSSLHSDDHTPARWRYVDRKWWSQNHIRVSGDPFADNFISVFSHPSEHFGSYHHYTKKNELVTSCRAWGPGSPIIPTYKVDGEFNFSHAMWGSRSNVFYSFGMVPEYLVPTNRPPETIWYDTVFFQYGGNAAFTTNGYMNPFGWVDIRKNQAPSFVTYAKPPANVTFTPPLAGSVVFNTEGNSIPISPSVRGLRRQPECARENYKPNTFDIPPAFYKKDITLVGAGKVNPNVHWRAAVVQKVTAPDGREVSVVILTDTHNGFMFYEARDYTTELPPVDPNEFDSWVASPSYRNIPEARRVYVKPTMPSWVTVPDDSGAYMAKTWLWRFNREGTKAVSTPVNVVQKKMWAKVWPEEAGLRTVDLYPTYPEIGNIPTGLVEVLLYSVLGLTPELASGIRGIAEHIQNQNPNPTSNYLVQIGSGYGTYFFELDGRLHLYCDNVTSIDENGFDSVVRDHVIPLQEVTPGLVEVSLSVQLSYVEGDVELSPQVSVIRSDYYDASGKMYADAAYYVATPRASVGGGANVLTLPADDALLVADIALRSRYIPSIGLEVYAYYRVTNFDSGAVAASFCIAAGTRGNFAHTEGFAESVWPRVLTANLPTSRIGAYFVANLLAFDLRYLSFLTASYHRKSAMPAEFTGFTPGGAAFAVRGNVLPRICLRVPGEATKVVNYSQSVLDGDYPVDAPVAHGNEGPNNYGVDPMRNIGLDYQPNYGGFPPLEEGVLSFSPYGQILTAGDVKELYRRFLCFVTPGQYYMTFSFTPTGDYAVYFDARSSQFTPIGNTTEMSGVIDVIKIGKKKTSHKAVFNAAFRKTLGYDYYPVDQDTPSASGRFGMNGIFMYNVPLGLVAGSQVQI